MRTHATWYVTQRAGLRLWKTLWKLKTGLSVVFVRKMNKTEVLVRVTIVSSRL